MPNKPHIEPGALSDGTVVYRWVCTSCSPNRYGVWLKDLTNVERIADKHARAMHPATQEAA